MKKFIYQKLYIFLSFISNYIFSRRLITWKIMTGTSLLLLSGSCTQPKQKSQPLEDKIPDAQLTSTKETAKEEVFCYDSISSPGDTLQSENKVPPPPPPPAPPAIDILITVACYDVLVIEDPLTCYLPIIESSPENVNKDSVYQVVEKNPEFTEGNILEYMQQLIVYPPDALEQEIQGRVIVEVVIERDGSVTNPNILRSIHPSLDSMAIEVINQLPKWQPGMHRGDSVRVRYVLPVNFRINQYLEQQEKKAD